MESGAYQDPLLVKSDEITPKKLTKKPTKTDLQMTSNDQTWLFSPPTPDQRLKQKCTLLFHGKKTASVPVVYGFFPCFLFRVSWVPYIFTAASVEPIESAACWSCRISSCGSCCSFTREKVWTSMMVVEGPLLLLSLYRIFVYTYIYICIWIYVYIAIYNLSRFWNSSFKTIPFKNLKPTT